MAQTKKDRPVDDLDAFFSAAGSDNPLDIKIAAENVAKTAGRGVVQHPHAAALPSSGRAGDANIPASAQLPDDGPDELLDQLVEDLKAATDGDALEGKYFALDPASLGEIAETSDAPFVLVPANIHKFLPWWGWLTIGLGLGMLVIGVVLTPVISLNRLASRLGDKSEANVQYAMRQLVLNGDERTVKKLYNMASSQDEGMTVRLRAIDTMSLIEQVPEVDRALLRLELSTGTANQVREAAIAARKQREAARTRGQR